MRKIEEMQNPESTWNRIPPDEEVFIIRAKDICSENAVLYYAFLAQVNGAPPQKIEGVLSCARRMGIYPGPKKVPD